MNAMQAKEIMIVDYLKAQGVSPVKQLGVSYWYCSPLRKEYKPSFKVNVGLNAWYDYGLCRGGNIIDLVMELQGFHSVSQVLKHLDGNTPSRVFNVVPDPNPLSEGGIVNLRVSAISNKVLVDYIASRGIDMVLALLYCKQVNYCLRDKEYFAIGYLNNSGGYELNNKYFKGAYSPKDISTYEHGFGSCLVFEGFWDFLSYLTLKNIQVPSHNVAVLNSVNNVSKALHFIASHGEVFSFLDNDVAGQRATQVLRLGCDVFTDQSVHYAQFNDLNDYLCGKRQVKIDDVSEKNIPVRKGRRL